MMFPVSLLKMMLVMRTLFLPLRPVESLLNGSSLQMCEYRSLCRSHAREHCRPRVGLSLR